MALSGSTIWECRNGGSDTNGGGYVSGGTDYTLQTAAQIAVADAVANGTTTITSATAAFDSTHVGNLVYLSGGSGSLAATRRQVASVTNATTIVVDATVAAGTGISLNLGGALASLAEAFQTTPRGMAQGNTTFWKYNASAFTTASTVTISGGGNALTCRLIGYDTTRTDTNTDANRPTLQATASMTNVLVTGAYSAVRNVIVDCGGTGKGQRGLLLGANYGVATRCKVINFIDIGIFGNDPFSSAHNCEVTAGTSAAQGGLFAGQLGFLFHACSAHDNACPGAKANTRGVYLDCAIVNNTGASSDGIQVAAGGSTPTVIGCVIHGNGRHGVNYSGSADQSAAVLFNNVITLNGGFGVSSATTWAGFSRLINYNAFGGGASANVSGPRSGVPAGPNDVILTGDPYTNAAGNDFSLISTGAGLQCRAAGSPGLLPGLSTTGYTDIGIQHPDAGGGGSNIYLWMEG